MNTSRRVFVGIDPRGTGGSDEVSSIVAKSPMPAIFTKRSSPPNCSMAPATAASRLPQRGHVMMEERRPATSLGDAVGYGTARLVVEVGHQHLGALTGRA